MRPKTAPVSFRLEITLKRRLQAMAKADQRTLTSFIAKVLTEAANREARGK